MIKLLLLSILMHIIDDFVLQPVCLSKLKQKSFWESNAPDDMYKYDYIAALIIHALSWSIMIALPYMLLVEINEIVVLCCIIINTCIHAYIDDIKANRHKINLITDQLCHLAQIIVTFLLLS
ncbi:MAG: membrane protein [Wendovervirus sonii]|uniref:Membrane protein n=1 Tax=phage Lak_Megaphage_Sonny TaxID=3109229 RepID=A0ABZ0Z2M3_9CAUD|nr:MAG: membrane protein [phage Lak_Megaphage_Sonny]